MHYDCSDLGPNISLYENTDKEFYCGSSKCNLKVLPFNGYSISFINTVSFLPKCGTVFDKNKQSISKPDIAPPMLSSFTNRERLNMLKKKSADSSYSVYFDPFLDIKCNYKCPTEISDEFLGDPHTLKRK